MMSKEPARQTQRDRFIETARKLGADEDEAAFKAKLAVIARQKPKGSPIETAQPLVPTVKKSDD